MLVAAPPIPFEQSKLCGCSNPWMKIRFIFVRKKRTHNYAAGLEASRFNEKFEVTWSCSNTHVSPGDNIYLIILGNNGVRGIIAAGKAISKVFEVPHWDYKKAAKGQKTTSVKVSFSKILDF